MLNRRVIVYIRHNMDLNRLRAQSNEKCKDSSLQFELKVQIFKKIKTVLVG